MQKSLTSILNAVKNIDFGMIFKHIVILVEELKCVKD